ncbi:MAG TPA: transposase [Anaerolineales bacterium]
MTQHSLTTRLDHYINTMLPETHAHQRKAFRDFVAALLVVRTCCQATLARYFANFEAASRRLTRWLHNPRLDVQAQAHAHAQLRVHQLPRTGTVRVAIDWTTEAQQHLLVASVSVGRRAVPLYWEAYTTKERKGQQRAVEQAFRRQVVEKELATVARERLLLTADRGFGDGTLLAELARLQVPFVLRLPANITVCLEQQWQKLGSLRMNHTTRRRALGRLWCLRSNPQRCGVTQARARNKKGRWDYWHLVSNRPLSAFTMASEYARRFGCEEGFRDAKHELGFAAARIAHIEAWARMFALVAAALLILTQLGTHLLRHPQRQAWLRQVRSRRRTRSELSLIVVVCHLLDQGVALWLWLTPHTQLNLEAAL